MESADALHLASELEAILDNGREEKIHQFLAANTSLFNFVGERATIWSKYRLGTEFVTDFVSVGDEMRTNDPRPLVVFIEIERADLPLFTSKGDPAAFLTHAIRQVQDWKRWVTANRDYFARDLSSRWSERDEVEAGLHEDRMYISRDQGLRRRLVDHFVVDYRVVAGRRNRMRVEERLRLAQMNDDLANINIITYDVILDGLLHRAHRSSRIG